MTNINFDSYINRHGTYTKKWERLNDLYGREDLMAFWIADMDFRTSDKIIEALAQEINFGIFGYPDKLERCRQALKRWMQKRHQWDINDFDISFFPRVMGGIAIAIECFTKPGDKIVVQPPIYPPFMTTVNAAGRNIIYNKLIKNNGQYIINYEDLERIFKNGARFFMFCNPHNPVGRVWSLDELKHLAKLCMKYDIKVFCDEIHHDLVYSESHHYALASIYEEFSKNVITFVAPTKTFNLAGLMASAAIITDKDMAKTYNVSLERFDIQINQFGQTAFYTAYEQGEEWLESLLPYLQANRDYVAEMLNHSKAVSAFKPEGTYLYWLDFSTSGHSHDEIQNMLVNKAKIALFNGKQFGMGGEKFARLNIACPRSYLARGVENILKVFK